MNTDGFVCGTVTGWTWSWSFLGTPTSSWPSIVSSLFRALLPTEGDTELWPVFLSEPWRWSCTWTSYLSRADRFTSSPKRTTSPLTSKKSPWPKVSSDCSSEVKNKQTKARIRSQTSADVSTSGKKRAISRFWCVFVTSVAFVSFLLARRQRSAHGKAMACRLYCFADKRISRITSKLILGEIFDTRSARCDQGRVSESGLCKNSE